MARNARGKGVSAEYFRLAQFESSVVRGVDVDLSGRDCGGRSVDDIQPRYVAGCGCCYHRIVAAADGVGDEAGIGEQEVDEFFPVDSALSGVWSSKGEGADDRKKSF